MEAKYLLITALVIMVAFFGVQLFNQPQNLAAPITLPKVDSDGDGLTDEEEQRLGTDPKNFNSDRDRYSDGEEVKRGSNPLVANTAKIRVTKSNARGEHDLIAIAKLAAVSAPIAACIKVTLGACAAALPAVGSVLNAMLDDTVYTSKVDFVLENSGDDYTNHLRYDVVHYLGGETLSSDLQEYGRLDAAQKITKTFTYKIKVRDIPAAVWNLILQKGDVRIEVENLDYERFG